MTEVGCFVDGCDFVFDVDDPNWHERYEQHVRWLHVTSGDFGAQPVASLFGLLAYGVIQEDEFVRFAGKTLANLPPAKARDASGSILFGRCVSVVGSFLAILLLAWNGRVISLDRVAVSLILLAVAAAFLGVDLTFRRIERAVAGPPNLVRIERYPDTEDDDDDSGGVST